MRKNVALSCWLNVLDEPRKYGYEECPHCFGYGTSFKDPKNVTVCSFCKGRRIIEKHLFQGYMNRHPELVLC